MALRLIALEEHYLSNRLLESDGLPSKKKLTSVHPTIYNQLVDTGSHRISDMDKHSIGLQVLSHVPVHPTKDVVRRTNDDLGSIISRNPTRYAGFALLSMDNAEEAAMELERSVNQHGFVGALIGNNLDDGGFYDTEQYDSLWLKAQQLDVPIYLHPAFPSQQQMENLYNGPYDSSVAVALGCWSFGWHSMTGLHVLRLFAAKVFDRHPKLKIIIGHMGEMLPFMLDRIIKSVSSWPADLQPRRTLRQVWDENIWVTTSGVFALGPIKCLLEETKVDRILFSIDYPYAPNEAGAKFIQDLASSGIVTNEELEGIAYKNAAKLLGLKVEQQLQT